MYIMVANEWGKWGSCGGCQRDVEWKREKRWDKVLLVGRTSFFFSSRRRHTRCSRDWSSDVCSSDLKIAREAGADLVVDRKAEDVAARIKAFTRGLGLDRVVEVAFEANLELNRAVLKANGVISTYSSGPPDRSEERRVGKELRWRWWA